MQVEVELRRREVQRDGFFSIHEIMYGTLEDWSLWLADRGQSPKSRRNFLGYFRTFLR